LERDDRGADRQHDSAGGHGVLAEAVMFFLPVRTMSLPLIGKLLAWAFLAFVATFALTNSLRMASIVSADQAAARVDRQTEGVRTADQALEVARAKRDEACGRGLGKTVACQSRQAEVAKLEAKQTQATNKVTAQAKPESTDFAKLVAWVSMGAISPGAEDFDMLGLLFRTLLPQVGGLVLLLAGVERDRGLIRCRLSGGGLGRGDGRTRGVLTQCTQFQGATGVDDRCIHEECWLCAEPVWRPLAAPATAPPSML
jgi:hypothetical protein